MKKSLELTLEVGKQLQIQKNLLNLNKQAKKHLRQSSQPAVGRKGPAVPSISLSSIKIKQSKPKT